MSTDDSNTTFELSVELRSSDYYPDDDRWRSQVNAYQSELHGIVDTRVQSRPFTGSKGGVDELIVALGSAGAFTAAVESFRAWLSRDRGRRIEVRWDDDGVDHFVSLTGEAIDIDSVRAIAAAAAHRVGGSGWPDGTAHS
ncbi:hypothetical protein SAMN05892883_0639 [Jatrophihabitans sp. GAS493]|uniref:effector-associated constant component EACC1 n=1 Tax=Jatrophihabitans sp. GAS493 TaxID=1907575 RepID=UPI000BB67716|nr:hypothetical protein [Jatrophihabitans sp. GAS493]SOD71038.1 hypothetical protein SAMN05892883_0639 [Jatrophihabitans sp. GAS493]